MPRGHPVEITKLCQKAGGDQSSEGDAVNNEPVAECRIEKYDKSGPDDERGPEVVARDVGIHIGS